MPRFVLNWIRRVLHEDEINDAMTRIGHLEGIDFCKGGLNELNVKIKVKGLENIPKKGGVILASNHPLGGLDGIGFIAAVSEVRDDISFLVNDILMNFKNLSNLFIPVNKVGSNSKESLKKIEEVYASEQTIMIFPAGLVSRKQKGGIRDLEWKKSFVQKAFKYQKPIIPVYIDGKNSKFFYRLSKWRKKLGIKANLEMFFLSEEMFKQRNNTITITFGKALIPEKDLQGKNYSALAEEIKEKVYNLSVDK